MLYQLYKSMENRAEVLRKLSSDKLEERDMITYEQFRTGFILGVLAGIAAAAIWVS